MLTLARQACSHRVQDHLQLTEMQVVCADVRLAAENVCNRLPGFWIRALPLLLLLLLPLPLQLLLLLLPGHHAVRLWVLRVWVVEHILDRPAQADAASRPLASGKVLRL